MSAKGTLYPRGLCFAAMQFLVHLRGCAACAEEAESLVWFVATQHRPDVGPEPQRLHRHSV